MRRDFAGLYGITDPNRGEVIEQGLALLEGGVKPGAGDVRVALEAGGGAPAGRHGQHRAVAGDKRQQAGDSQRGDRRARSIGSCANTATASARIPCERN